MGQWSPRLRAATARVCAAACLTGRLRSHVGLNRSAGQGLRLPGVSLRSIDESRMLLIEPAGGSLALGPDAPRASESMGPDHPTSAGSESELLKGRGRRRALARY